MVDLTTTILGPVDLGVADFARFTGGAYTDLQVAQFAAALVAHTGGAGLRTSVVAGQIAKETGWFRFGGQVDAAQFNFAGLGATNGGAAGASFPTIDDGVLAVCQHWLVYAIGSRSAWPAVAAGWPVRDTRYQAVIEGGNAGTVRTLGDLTNGRWAYSPQYPIGSLANGYATGIATLASLLIEGGPVVGAAVPWDRVHISADLGPERTLESIKWGIVHDTEGHFDGDELVLTSAGPPVESANILIGRQPGQCVLIAPLTTTAWAAGNDEVGIQAFQVELSKATNESDYTDYQYTKLAECFRYARAQGMINVPFVYLGLHPADANGGPEPDDAGIIGHAGVPNPAGLSTSPAWGGFGGHTDPGPGFDWPRFIALLGEAPPGQVDDRRVFQETGRGITGPIKGFWEQFDDAKALEIFGFPVTERQDDGTQYFEKVILEDHAGTVMVRRQGAAAAFAAGFTGAGLP